MRVIASTSIRRESQTLIPSFFFVFTLAEIPNYPNVDPFNYETMKTSLLERLDQFNAAPFTVQRLCELLIDPRKQYSRIDKFMRALEKNILGRSGFSFVVFFYTFHFMKSFSG